MSNEACGCFAWLQSLIVRDRVREFLEKEPTQRSDDEINVLLDFMQHLPVCRLTLPALLSVQIATDYMQFGSQKLLF